MGFLLVLFCLLRGVVSNTFCASVQLADRNLMEKALKKSEDHHLEKVSSVYSIVTCGSGRHTLARVFYKFSACFCVFCCCCCCWGGRGGGFYHFELTVCKHGIQD